jgi:RNA polymerase sigma-70 factor (ECF subfamily)
MNEEAANDRLSKISTAWSLMQLAHGTEADAAAAAQQQIVQRYGGAVYRYLRAALRDPVAADDLAQEFALALVRGQLRHADPERGRFRDYVKTVLFHLVSKHRKKQGKQPQQLAPAAPALDQTAADPDRDFDESWRQELLTRTLEALARAQPTYHAVLRFRFDHPDVPSHEMAEPLGRQLGKPVTAEGVRQTLRRARALFAELLVDEVAHSLRSPSLELVEQELGELGLLSYCRPVLERRGHRKKG